MRAKGTRTVLILGPSREAVSGVTTHVNTLLESSLAAGYSLVHFQVGAEGRRETALGMARRVAASPWQLAAAILRHGATIVHVNCSLNAKSWWRDLAYVAVAKLCGARVVLQKHGGELDRFCANKAFFRFVQAALRLPDAIVVLSRAELDAYRRFVPGQRIEMVPNGIDTQPFLRCSRSRRAAAAQLQLVYVGRLAPGKGLPETLEALALARAKGLQPTLVIAGSGPQERELRARVASLALASQVRFAGPAWGAAKTALLAEADVLVLPSHSEGLPYALLEAMAAGVVPLVTPVGAIPDVVADGVHGRFVRPGDAAAIAEAVASLDADRAALARMSEACRERIARGYSRERLARDFALLYSTLAPWPASQAG
jgi:glycosyltransferase involved in cell wall biosynthesis